MKIRRCADSHQMSARISPLINKYIKTATQSFFICLNVRCCVHCPTTMLQIKIFLTIKWNVMFRNIDYRHYCHPCRYRVSPNVVELSTRLCWQRLEFQVCVWCVDWMYTFLITTTNTVNSSLLTFSSETLHWDLSHIVLHCNVDE